MRRGLRVLALAALAGAPGGALAQGTVDVLRDGLPPLTCLSPQGTLPGGIPVAALCGLSGELDQPIDPFLPVQARTRAGAVNATIAKQLLGAARGALGEAEFAALDALPLLDQEVSPTGLVIATTGFWNGLARAIRADGIRKGDPEGAIVGRLDALAQQVLGDPTARFEDMLNARFDALLAARADRDRAALVLSPGYSTTPTADSVHELDVGMALDFTRSVDPLLGGLFDFPQLRFGTIPLFIGPGGRRDDADDLPVVRCPPGTLPIDEPGGRCQLPDGTTDPLDPALEPLYYVAFTGSTLDGSAALAVGLDPASPGDIQLCLDLLPSPFTGGINALGECIVTSDRARFDPSSGTLTGDPTLAALRSLQDRVFRPPEAWLEPTVLTDLRLRGSRGALPARPHHPGGIFYPNAGLGQFARRTDAVTGAPVNATGPLACGLRTDGTGQVVGPNGVAGDLDDAIPSAGNCLLYDDAPAPVIQPLRSEAGIAASHPANQTLFHRLCAIGFDEDVGQCDGDALNNPRLFGAISNSLSGQRGLGGLLADGFRTVRLAPKSADPFDPRRYLEMRSGFEDGLFAQVPLTTEQAFSTSMTVEQRALLGCGPAFATACDQTAVNLADDSFRDAAGIDTSLGEVLLGGIDLLAARADALLQEWIAQKVTSPNALVGVREDGAFEAGVATGGLTVGEAEALGPDATPTARSLLATALGTTLDDPRTATDLQVEPMKWLVATPATCAPWGPGGATPDAPFFAECLAQAAGHDQGIVRFVDPRGPNGVWDGGAGDDVFDSAGESCTPVHGGPDPGCTPLEVVFANLQRLLIALEIVGQAGVHEPPQTAEEVQRLLDDVQGNEVDADPRAGPDGIRFANFDRDMDGRITDGLLDGDQRAKVLDSAQFVADDFAGCLTASASTDFCFLNLDTSNPIGPVPPFATSTGLVAALPLGMRLSVECVVPGTCPFLDLSSPGTSGQVGDFETNRMVRLQGLTPLQLQRLVAVDYQILTIGEFFATEGVEVDAAALGIGPQGTSVIARPVVRTLRLGLVTKTLNPNARIGDSNGRRLLLVDLDNDGAGTPDLDEDQDDAFDFVDDGTRGPGSVSSMLCGSGIPGDPLQEAMQVELDAEQQALLAAAFPDGLPRRSPVFCGGLASVFGLTGVLPSGRRAFLWHGVVNAEPGDVDGDGDVDRNDLDAVLAARNTPAVGPDDPLDVDGDGRITALDARKLVTFCTREMCADETGVALASLTSFDDPAPAGPTPVPALGRWGALLLAGLLVAGSRLTRAGRFGT